MTLTLVPDLPSTPSKAARGTTNGNRRGSAETRRRRKQWLLETYASDVRGLRISYSANSGPTIMRGGFDMVYPDPKTFDACLANWLKIQETKRYIVGVEVIPCCRCYRCGRILVFETLTVDRIIPGCHGGTYRRSNIRPACMDCNSETGGALARGKAHQSKKVRVP